MSALDIIRLVLLVLHFLGLAAIIGSFFVQMKRREQYALGPMLVGAIAQVVTGVALVGVDEANGHDVDMAKIAVKLVIALIVLAATIVAVVRQRRGGRGGAIAPWFHTAGGLAVINVLVAVLWP